MKTSSAATPAWLLARGVLAISLLAGCSSQQADGATTPGSGGGGGDDNAAGQPAAPQGGNADASNGGEPAAGGASAGTGSQDNAGAGGIALGSGGDASSGGVRAGAGGAPPNAVYPDPVYATSVESFAPGAGAGYNQAKMPGIVLGPPKGKGQSSGSLDVVSLGAGGSIVLAFGDVGIVDGPGPDFIVFENAFWPNGDATQVFAELGEVSVSEDGQTWHAFACDAVGDGNGNFAGCAGVTPTLAYDAATLIPLDPAQSGGDAFDLADLKLKHVRFVKIRDLETMPAAGTTSGFDLDAVGVIHVQ